MAACDFLDCDLTFTQNKEAEGMPCIPSAIGTDNYIKMLMCMVYVLNHLTTNRKIEVKLCNYREETEVRMTTNAEKLPAGISDFDGLLDSVPVVRQNLRFVNLLPAAAAESCKLVQCTTVGKYLWCLR